VSVVLTKVNVQNVMWTCDPTEIDQYSRKPRQHVVVYVTVILREHRM